MSDTNEVGGDVESVVKLMLDEFLACWKVRWWRANRHNYLTGSGAELPPHLRPGTFKAVDK